MALRKSPPCKIDRKRLRQLQLRRKEEQDRIIRIIKGKKEVIVNQGTVKRK
jgi:Trk K+ transport system NAD-binding subunit